MKISGWNGVSPVRPLAGPGDSLPQVRRGGLRRVRSHRRLDLRRKSLLSPEGTLMQTGAPPRASVSAIPVPAKDSHFNHASLGVRESVGRVNRRFSVATDCSARMSWLSRAGADAKMYRRRC